jgi:hypothetical protein
MTNLRNAMGERVVDKIHWRSVSTDNVEYAKALLETKTLMQWLARISNSYAPGRTAEERILLEFRADQAVFVTRPFGEKLALEMRMPTLRMQFLEDGRPAPHVLDPEEHSPAEVEAWLLVELLHRGVDRSKFSKALPYGVNDLMTGDAEDHSPGSCREGLVTLSAWLQNAAGVLNAVGRGYGVANASIICSPETLDLSFMKGSESKLAELGFCPGNDQMPEPSFYRVETGARRKRRNLKSSELLALADPAAAAIAFLTGDSK